MTSLKSMVVISALLLIAFFSNVLFGAFYDKAFLSDVGEASLLLITTFFFVASILAAEKRAKNE